MQRWLLPPLALNQYQLYQEENGDRPTGLVTWAWFSPEVEQEYVRNSKALQPADWNSGERGWIIDFIAPFGHAKEIVSDLRNDVFPDKVGRFLRAKKNSNQLRIIYIHGAQTLNSNAERPSNPPVLLS